MADKKITTRLGELRAMAETELDTVVEDNRRNIYTIIRTRISKPVENMKAIRNSRKEIARVLTIKRQRELGISPAPVAPAPAPKAKAKAKAKA